MPGAVVLGHRAASQCWSASSSRCSWQDHSSATNSKLLCSRRLDHCPGQLRPLAAAAHLGGDLRLRRQRADRNQSSTSCSAPAARASPAAGPWFVFWGYQLFIVLAGTGYLLGITQGKEYAEPEWYADLWLTVVWVAYLLVFLGTLWKRKEPHIYVANWFYLAFIVTIAMLHIVNNLACR
jgi:hypothetical protein